MTAVREHRGRRKVFLSGMIDGVAIAESSGWRQEAVRVLSAAGFDTYDPTRVILASRGDYRPRPNEVFTNDRWHLARSDVLLANLNLPPVIESHKAPFFTIGEMFLAHAAGLPVITFGSCFRGRAGYEAIVTRSFDEMGDALAYITDYYA